MKIIQIFVLIFAISGCQSNPLLSNFPGKKTSADVTLSPLDYESAMQKGAAAYKSENFSLALSYFKPLSKAGLGDAQAMLGYMYLDGQGVPQNTSEALLWLEKAANQGVSEASTMLGHAYLDGDKGFKQSDQDGAYWFFRAALRSEEHTS